MHSGQVGQIDERSVANAFQHQRLGAARANGRQGLELGRPGVIDVDPAWFDRDTRRLRQQPSRERPHRQYLNDERPSQQ